MDVANQLLNRYINIAGETIAAKTPFWEDIAFYNQQKVLSGFQQAKINQGHFQRSTGYGYNDLAREGLEEIFCHVFQAERALVRSQIVSGTHAIACCLFGLLRQGDQIVSITGTPYDTLLPVIGAKDHSPGSLAWHGINYKEIPLNSYLKPDKSEIINVINNDKPKLVFIQRSRGYRWRPSLTVDEIGELVALIKKSNLDTICFVDNCYGEFVEKKEPLEVGADIIAGSLIKNPGGGLAPAGGYIAGKRELVGQVACRLTAPGISDHVGASLIDPRLLYQGFFLAPHVVKEALITAIYGAVLFELLGFTVDPLPLAYRTDIIQAVRLNSKKKMLLVCKALQESSPVDSFVSPEASSMVGYGDEILMAGGTFIQGSSIELSADGPVREPYILYLQGALSKEHGKLAINHVIGKLVGENNESESVNY